MIEQPPFIEVPWRYRAEDGVNVCFYLGNVPEACVIHISMGWRSTAVAWATVGHYGASWGHYICLDGAILRHLQKNQGGFHAGVSKYRNNKPRPYPTWPLFKGWEEDGAPNVNVYTDSIEMEGQGEFTEAQKVSLKWLCQWLAQDRGYPYDRDHFPAHADIDLVDRANDFGSPAYREEIYKYLFEEDEMTKEDMVALFGSTERDPLTGRLLSVEERYPNAKARYDEAVATGKSLLEQVGQSGANLKSHIDGHTTGSAEAEHSHPEYVLKAELAEASD